VCALINFIAPRCVFRRFPKQDLDPKSLGTYEGHHWLLLRGFLLPNNSHIVDEKPGRTESETRRVTDYFINYPKKSSRPGTVALYQIEKEKKNIDHPVHLLNTGDK
jgi:hypothetical protein